MPKTHLNCISGVVIKFAVTEVLHLSWIKFQGGFEYYFNKLRCKCYAIITGFHDLQND